MLFDSAVATDCLYFIYGAELKNALVWREISEKKWLSQGDGHCLISFKKKALTFMPKSGKMA